MTDKIQQEYELLTQFLKKNHAQHHSALYYKQFQLLQRLLHSYLTEKSKTTSDQLIQQSEKVFWLLKADLGKRGFFAPFCAIGYGICARIWHLVKSSQSATPNFDDGEDLGESLI